MKKFMKKSVSWVLTVAMVCPMIAQTLAFLPISFANDQPATAPSDTDSGAWTDWDGWVLENGAYKYYSAKKDKELDSDEIAAAVAYFKAHNTSDGLLENVMYNTASMYNYNDYQFNAAMHAAEMKWYEDNPGKINSLLEPNTWNGLYFGQGWSDGYDIYNREKVTINTETVSLPDGEYYLKNARSGGYVANGSDDPNNVLSKKETVEALETKDALTFKKIPEAGVYTIQNSEGKYLNLPQQDHSEFVDTQTTFVIYKSTNNDAKNAISIQQVETRYFLNAKGLLGNTVGGYNEGTLTGNLKDKGSAFELHVESNLKPVTIQTGTVEGGLYTVTGLKGDYWFKSARTEQSPYILPRTTTIANAPSLATQAEEPSVNERFKITPVGDDPDTNEYTIQYNNQYMIFEYASDGIGDPERHYKVNFIDPQPDENAPTFWIYQGKGANQIAIRSQVEVNADLTKDVVLHYYNDGYVRGLDDRWLSDEGSAIALYQYEVNIRSLDVNQYPVDQYPIIVQSLDLSGKYMFQHPDNDQIPDNDQWLYYSNNSESFAGNNLATIWTLEESADGAYLLKTADGKYLSTVTNSYYVADGNVYYTPILSDDSNSAVEFEFYRYNANNLLLKTATSYAHQNFYLCWDGNGFGYRSFDNIKAAADAGAYFTLSRSKVDYPYLRIMDYAKLNGYTDYVDADKKQGDWDGDEAYPGIVKSELDANNNIQFKGADAGVFGDTQVNGKDIYHNVGVPFIPIVNEANNVPYTTYVFDSDLFDARFNGLPSGDTNLTAKSKSENNWWPFSYYGSNNGTDVHFGMTLTIPFTMEEDGKINHEDDITFSFRGDDDVWIFIDGQLVLDLGGIHDRLGGTLNFADNSWELDYPDSVDYIGHASTKGYLFNGVDENGVVKVDESNELLEPGVFDKTLAQFSADGTHELTIFYLERGAGESNCRITYNMPMSDYLTVSKTVSANNEAFSAITKEEQEIVSGHEFGFTLYQESKNAPVSGSFDILNQNGQKMGSRTTEANGHFTLKDGETARFLLNENELDNKDGATFYVVEDAEFGFGKTIWSYDGIASKVLNLPDVTTINDPAFVQTRPSGQVTAVGDIGTLDIIHFYCNNSWSFTDTIVIDYGLPVDIDFSQLSGWKDSVFALSDLEVLNKYDSDGDGTPDEKVQYGTVSDPLVTGKTFELENKDGENIIWSANVSLQPDNKGIIQGIGDTDNDYVIVNYNSGVACRATIAIYYATSLNRYMLVTVNNEKSHIVTCVSNDSWDKTREEPVYVTVDLKEGQNQIVLQGCDASGVVAAGNNAPNLDKIVIEPRVTYQLTEQMTAVDLICYTVTATDLNGKATPDVPGMIYIVPATVMYYEENFEGQDNNTWINYADGDNYAAWDETDESDEDDDPQEMGVVGVEGNHVYGSDDAYLSDKADSNGTSMHVTTTTTTPAQFSYTFMGTGTTFYARTNNNSGYMKVEITDYSTGNPVFTYYRDTRYIDNPREDDTTTDSDSTLYNIPVFSWDAVKDSNLGYGQYTVTVTIAKEVYYEGEGVDLNTVRPFYGTEFWLDGIRVFNPLDRSIVQQSVMMLGADDEDVSISDSVQKIYDRVTRAQDAYAIDGEYNPSTDTVRQKILADNEAADGGWQVQNNLNYASVFSQTFTDSNSAIRDVNEFWLRGPKEEVYLDSASKQSVTIYLKADGLNLDKARVHIGIKTSLANDSVNGKIIVNEGVNDNTIAINNAPDCYYDITDKLVKAGDNWYKAEIRAESGLISVTNIKVTGTNGYDILAVS